LIKFEQVSKTYPGGQQALRKVDFHVEQGEMAFLTGHSGAGKSTLLKLISIMERPTVGKVLINGHDLSAIKRKQIAYIRRDIGMIFQSHQLLMDKSVYDNVSLPLVIEGHTRKNISRRVDAALEMVGLRDKAKNLPITLSGGEQQRVGIARAVVNRPPLLLADEPTGNLDPKLSMEIIRLFEDFNQAGVSVFIATHDLGLIARMKYRTLTLKNGQMITDGLNDTSDGLTGSGQGIYR
jgi:cell division transport system ATP-binding protein